MNRSKTSKSKPMHKKNQQNPPRGRKPILSAQNLKRVSAQASGIRSTLGKIAGAGLTAAAKAVMGSVFGQGDYTVKYNSLTGAGGPPQFTTSGASRSMVACHREFVQDVTGSTAFSLQSFAISPTNNSLFPWLAQISQNFEEYRIHGMLFEFKTTSGMSVSSTNTALGTVIMATQYNPNDNAFSTKVEMENYEFATSGGPFENFLHPLECKPQLTVAPQLYVNQPIFAGAIVDQRLTNFGTFNIATVGMQASNVVGELWVTYMVELLKPRLSSLIVGNGELLALFNSNQSSANLFGTNGSTIQDLFISVPTNGERSLFNPGIVVNFDTTTALVNTPLSSGLNFAAGNVITLPNGITPGHTFVLTVDVVGTGLNANIVIGNSGTGPNLTIPKFTNTVSTDQTFRSITALVGLGGTTVGDRTFLVNCAATTVTSVVFSLVFCQ